MLLISVLLAVKDTFREKSLLPHKEMTLKLVNCTCVKKHMKRETRNQCIWVVVLYPRQPQIQLRTAAFEKVTKKRKV